MNNDLYNELFPDKKRKSRRTKKCPYCSKSDQVIPIVYGMPTADLGMEASMGYVKLGGCAIKIPESANPKWYCKRDDKEF